MPKPEVVGADVVEHHDVRAVFLSEVGDANDVRVLEVREDASLADEETRDRSCPP